ncbi:tRNA adenosine(34) deaminase TadA [Opitutales bacterium]|nr:tRNA adenosine(34) deaminase TadA [Opitutales bacterium]
MKIKQESLIPCPFEKVYPSQLNRDDTFFMRLAYNAAIDAYKQNEVPVGAVIEYQGDIIATSHNQVEFTRDATAHAEILAITQATQKVEDWRLKDCTLYVTKEPCPMCSGAAFMSRLDRVVFGVPDSKMGFLGGALDISKVQTLNHQIAITSGILEDECKALLTQFFSEKRTP